MNDFSKFSDEDLNRMDKHVLITIIRSLQGQLTSISDQLNFLTEQIALMNQRSFGRKTEKYDQIDNQLSLFEMYDCFNEPEALSDDSDEPDVTEVTISGYTRSKKTTREEKLEGLPARVFNHELTEEELKECFPEGYKELPVEIYKRLSVIPQMFFVDEHHVHVYASKNNDGTIIRAGRPADLFRNSLATPSLLSLITVNKYAKHLPLDRQSKEMEQFGIRLGTNTLANWMIRSSEMYLSLLYDELHKQLISDSHVVHADETPFEVVGDGRDACAKSYMWVYRNGSCDSSHPIVLFDYQPTRKTDHPDEFLKDYEGILVTDGYQVYHSLEKKRKGLMVARCWVHAKRKFAELVKTLDPDKTEGIIAAEATKRISKLFQLDNKFDDLSPDERLKQRQLTLKPRVDKFFAWAKESVSRLPAESHTAKALQYSINQEQFLKVFLDDPDVPMDNNRAEQAIRPFTIGRKNWVIINSPAGASASAVLYSLIETAKVNHVQLFEYFDYLLTELANHTNDKKKDFLQDLLPWSETVQEKFHLPQKKKS